MPDTPQAPTHEDLLSLTAAVVSSYLGNNQVPAAELPTIVTSVYSALKGQGVPQPEPEQKLTPAVPIKRSITPDYIVSLESGKKMKMLKRYLQTNYGMTPEQYRTKWGLASDYPMVAPNYSTSRSALAKSAGLGRKPAPEPEPTPEPVAPKRRGRKKAE